MSAKCQNTGKFCRPIRRCCQPHSVQPTGFSQSSLQTLAPSGANGANVEAESPRPYPPRVHHEPSSTKRSLLLAYHSSAKLVGFINLSLSRGYTETPPLFR